MSNFITEIKIKKVRHLENIDIKLGNEKKHLILTGKNGCGKTSVLERINGLLISNYLLNYDMNVNDMLKNGISISFKEQLFYSYLENTQGYFIYSFFEAKRKGDFFNPNGINKVYFDDTKPSEKLNNSFLQHIVNLKAERSFARDDNDMESVMNIDIWFKKFEKILKQIFNDDTLYLTFDRKNYNFIIHRTDRDPFDFNGLSDGYSAIIDIITEILLKIETTESKSFDCEGIVLIDEVETHLHVELQKNILPLLTSFFPNIQFIVTTHSPFVLQSIENSVVFDLERKESLSGKRLHIASYTDIVKNYFEVDSEFSKVLENKIVRYEELVDLFEDSTLDIEGEKELLNLDIKLDEIAPMMSKNIFLRFKESQDRINEDD